VKLEFQDATLKPKQRSAIESRIWRRLASAVLPSIAGGLVIISELPFLAIREVLSSVVCVDAQVVLRGASTLH
jgi:hypothetical protein